MRTRDKRGVCPLHFEGYKQKRATLYRGEINGGVDGTRTRDLPDLSGRSNRKDRPVVQEDLAGEEISILAPVSWQEISFQKVPDERASMADGILYREICPRYDATAGHPDQLCVQYRMTDLVRFAGYRHGQRRA